MSNRYPITKKMKYAPVAKKSSKNVAKPVSFSPNMLATRDFFSNGIVSDRYATKENRVHCVGIERRAIFKDAYGNSMVLKEDMTTMNLPKEFQGSLRYNNNNRRWKKK